MTEGTCKPGFERVAEAFQKNFDAKGEVGASVCLTVGGETVVDLWGGIADPEDRRAVDARTRSSIVFSCTKGATALCAHVLASRGKLDLDAPVAELWPEFGQARQGARDHAHDARPFGRRAGAARQGEGQRSLRMGLHDRRGWPTRRRSGSPARATAITASPSAGRSARWCGAPRGMSLGTFFQNEIAKPLGLDFWIGLPEEIEPRVAPIIALRLQGGRGQDAVHARSRDQTASRRRRCSSSTSAPGAPAAPTRRDRPRRRDRRGQRHHQRARAGRHVRAAGATAAASWSTARRWRAWARSRWRRTTTPPCASRRASRWAS